MLRLKSRDSVANHECRLFTRLFCASRSTGCFCFSWPASDPWSPSTFGVSNWPDQPWTTHWAFSTQPHFALLLVSSWHGVFSQATRNAWLAWAYHSDNFGKPLTFRQAWLQAKTVKDSKNLYGQTKNGRNDWCCHGGQRQCSTIDNSIHSHFLPDRTQRLYESS